MEKESIKRYRKNLAKDLLTLKKENPEGAYEFLEHEREGLRYNIAENYQKEIRKNVQEVWINSKNEESSIKENQNNKIETNKEFFQKAIELIENNPDFYFAISGYGKLLNNDSPHGVESIKFSQKEQKMIKNEEHSELDLEYVPIFEGKLKNFSENWKYKKLKLKNGQNVNQINILFPFVATLKNGLSNSRQGQYLSLAVGYANDKVDLFKDNKELKELFKNPNNKKGKDFFRDLFSMLGNKHIPKYWKAFVDTYNNENNYNR